MSLAPDLRDVVLITRVVPEAVSDDELAAARALLTAEELARGAGFAREEDRRRFQVVRAALRRGVGAATGVPPARVELRTGPWGKPEADGVHVNASHTDGLALMALTRAGPVGVDVEQVERATRSDELELARRFFRAAEADALQAVPAPERPRAFLRLWTRKEAALKAWGRGVSGGLDRVDVREVGPGWTRLPVEEGGPVWVRDLDLGASFLGAVAVIADLPPEIVGPAPHAG